MQTLSKDIILQQFLSDESKSPILWGQPLDTTGDVMSGAS